MIIIQLTGGLGNQLFQYAMGRMLAIKHNTHLKLDISFFENYEWHEYSLAPFSMEASIASEQDVSAIVKKNQQFIEGIRYKLFKLMPLIINEENLFFNKNYFRIRNNSYLIGYWQSEKYFEQISHIIRDELKIKVKPSIENQNLLDEIFKQNQSVSLHIRRGNYVNIDIVNKVHGTAKLDYYYQAELCIEKYLDKPIFYIFSDDINWAKENLKLKHPMVFVDINDDKTDFEDLRLMSACKHNILANSTFSWWGAWLNTNNEKLVIAPKEWFADPDKNKQSNTIIPESWIRL